MVASAALLGDAGPWKRSKVPEGGQGGDPGGGREVAHACRKRDRFP